MSFIRRNDKPNWEEDAGDGWYVYTDGERIQNLPRRHEPFIEVVMRMLDQSGELDGETLEEVHQALRKELQFDDENNADIEIRSECPYPSFNERKSRSCTEDNLCPTCSMDKDVEENSEMYEAMADVERYND